MKVSIIIPVIRPEKAERCISLVKENSGIKREDIEVVALEDKNRIGCPKMVKLLTDLSVGKYICFLGDDTIPQPGFIKYALEDMKRCKGWWGLVAFNDLTGRRLAIHWIASRKMLPLLDGEFFHTGYAHCFSDNELQDRCIKLGKFIYSDKAIVLHDHPILRKEKLTGDYARVYQPEIFYKDKALYESRRRQCQ